MINFLNEKKGLPLVSSNFHQTMEIKEVPGHWEGKIFNTGIKPSNLENGARRVECGNQLAILKKKISDEQEVIELVPERPGGHESRLQQISLA